MDDTENKHADQPVPAPPGGVMDFKPPEAQTPGVPPLGAPAEPVASPAEKPVGPIAPPPETKPTEPLGPVDAPPHDTPANASAHMPVHPVHKSHPPIAAVIVAVVIALALIGVTVFAYMRAKDNTKHEDAHDETTEQQQSAATTSDVDATTKEVDDTLITVDENKDFPESELTDQALGL